MEQLLILSILNNGCQVQRNTPILPLYTSKTNHVPEAQHYQSITITGLRSSARKMTAPADAASSIPEFQHQTQNEHIIMTCIPRIILQHLEIW